MSTQGVTPRTRVGDGVLQDVDLHDIVTRYGNTTISIRRAALVDVLAGALPPGTLQLNRRCVGFEQDQQGVTVRFADGALERAEVLIAADGIRSLVREQLFPGIKLRYSGQTCYRGIADWELPAELARTCWEVWGETLRVGFSAVGPGQVYWFAVRIAEPNGQEPIGSLADRLAAEYAHFPAPVPDMLRHTPDDIMRTDLYDFAPMRRWWQGRTVLLGDAAHAMTPNMGQGGAQAIEDAYVLAEQLARHPDPGQAFHAYERLRWRKVGWIVKTAWRFGRLAHIRPRPLQKMRNWLMKCTPEWVKQRQLDRLYSLNY